MECDDIVSLFKWRKMSPDACWMISDMSVVPSTLNGQKQYDVALYVTYTSTHLNKDKKPFSSAHFMFWKNKQVGDHKFNGKVYTLHPWNKINSDHCSTEFTLTSTITVKNQSESESKNDNN
jgi:hypothetical protein